MSCLGWRRAGRLWLGAPGRHSQTLIPLRPGHPALTLPCPLPLCMGCLTLYSTFSLPCSFSLLVSVSPHNFHINPPTGPSWPFASCVLSWWSQPTCSPQITWFAFLGKDRIWLHDPVEQICVVPGGSRQFPLEEVVGMAGSMISVSRWYWV